MGKMEAAEMPPALILCVFPGVVLFFEKNIKKCKKRC